MQFPSEFEWLSPDGGGLLTSYMPNHYGAGWVTHTAASLDEAEQAAYEQFRQLAPVAATRNVLLPVGGDHVIPSRWATGIHRDWNSRYVWPRFVTAVPSEFFAAVRKDAAERDVWITPQTRDMNPVYTGKDVSYVDTKQAQRAAETAVLDGERLATLAWLAGAEYPAAALDKAWRQLVFGAHHDAITGTESDQVYLDLLAGWREAYERGDAARREAAGHLARLAATAAVARADPRGDPGGPVRPAPRAVVVFNTLSQPRSGLARITLEFPDPGTPWAGLRDAAGDAVPALAEAVIRHDDGTLACLTLAFRAEDVPALGYRTYLAVPEETGAGAAGGWAPLDGTVIENGAFLVEADPARGGTLTRVLDQRLGTELLTGPGNELVLQDEYASHPRWGEGPWLLSPKGPGRGSAARAARVRAERCPIGARLIAELALDDLRVTQETLLWDGADRVEFRTHVDGSIGQDRLLRVRFPARVPGGLPVYQTALTVIGRPFGSAETDVAEHEFTLDNPAHEWFGIGSTARVAVTGSAGAQFRPPPRTHAIGVAEVITPKRDNGWREPVRDLMVTLARAGVTATCSRPDGPRYGSIDVDSNLPDVRVSLGGPAENPFTAEVLAAAGPDTAAALNRRLAAAGLARLWVPARLTAEEAFAPGADLRGALDLPVLIVAGRDLGAAIAAVTADLLDAVIEAEEDGAPGSAGPGPAGLAGHSVALLNRGTLSSLVTPDGTLNISLMRSCSAWPSGVWIDGDRRTAPDGSSFALQHWSHTFEYALAAGPGDWRSAGFAQAGQDYNHDLLACETSLHDGPLPATASLAAAEPATAWVSALKPRGNPLAPAAGQPRPQDGVIVRLRDASGRATATTASVTLFTGVAAAARTDPCEQDGGLPMPLRGGAAEAELPPAGTVTMVLTPGGLFAPDAPALAEPSPAPPAPEPALEPAQPVFTRYWLHGKGPAPAGNLPVAVHLSPGRIALPEAGGDTEDATAALRLTVACGTAPAAGTVQLAADGGIVLEPAGPLRYDLGPRGHARWDLAVRARPGARRGRHFVAARIADGAGQLLEDAALVSVGEPPPPALDRPLDELLPLYQADEQATAAELDLTLLTPDPQLRPGGRGEIAVRLSNATASQIRGEAQLVSSFGSWAGARPWTQGFTAEPSGGVTLTFTVTAPATARPGEQWWALVKVMYFGRVRYSEPAAVTITDRDRP
jgi:alpha-mannosidase